MKAAEWIDRVKVSKGLNSDYSVAKMLGLSRATVSKYRTITTTMDENSSIKVAEALGVPSANVLLDQYAEQTKDPAARTALFDVSRRLSILCKVLD